MDDEPLARHHEFTSRCQDLEQSCPFEVVADPAWSPDVPVADGSRKVQPFLHADGNCKMSYPKWCSSLVPLILRSRTDFAAFLAHTISLSRRTATPCPSTPALFPVPIFRDACFDRMPAGLSSQKRRRWHLSRAVHCICMALNFWHNDQKWVDDHALQREPNLEHFALYRRLAALIRSDGLSGSFELISTGRKSPELVARLGQLSQMVSAVGSCGAGYDRGVPGLDPSSDFDQVENYTPFTDLDASRLVLHGTGSWDVASLLSDELVMAYREPRSLLAGLDLGPHPVCRDSQAEVCKLAHVWDQLGLLGLSTRPRPLGSLVKIFNSRKSETVDRQIGDRRGQNSYECRIKGPSSDLPSGGDIMDLQVDVKRQKVTVIISDRKDYYHQIYVTPSRASTNAVGPALPLDLLQDTKGYMQFCLQAASEKRKCRVDAGDQLHDFGLWHPGECRQYEDLPAGYAYACFRAILQGDHCGVEIATDAHQQWLQKFGLLDASSRLTASRCLRSDSLLQGLVIDDYFAASIEDQGVASEETAAAECYRTCSRAYDEAKLLGSPQKDVTGMNSGKLVGAFVNSEPATLARGLCTVGASPEKRIALSFISLLLCQLRATTDALHLCLVGGWSSIFSFRRALMSLFEKVYKLVDPLTFDSSRSKIINLPRAVAQELVLAATLMPLAISDLGAEYIPAVYATDASNEKGAICVAEAKPRIVAALWKSCRSKGSYSRLLSPAQQILRRNAAWGEEYICDEISFGPDRPLGFCFDFIEVFSGASLITAALAAKNVTVGPPLDTGISEEYDLRYVRVLEWLTFMIAEKRLKAFMSSPPCTTFSIMRRPRLRSPSQPLGFDPLEEKTYLGNALGQRSGQLMKTAAVNGAAGLSETPYSSYLKYLPGWKNIRAIKQAEEVRCDSCRFGSIHLKPFRFLSVNMSLRRLARRCNCSGPHVKIEGVYTKSSATYVPELVSAIADSFLEAIRMVRLVRSAELDLKTDGLENQLVNEVALSSSWKTVSAWTFKKEKHINLLEEGALH